MALVGSAYQDPNMGVPLISPIPHCHSPMPLKESVLAACECENQKIPYYNYKLMSTAGFSASRILIRFSKYLSAHL